MASAYIIAIGTIIGVVTWMFLAFSIPGVPFGRTLGTLGGAVLMVVFTVLSPADAFNSLNLETLALLFGTMIVTVLLERERFFQHFISLLTYRCSSASWLLARVCLASGVLAALMTNDTVCVFFTPVIVALCERYELPHGPFLIALATSANIGSTATPVGNPQNMIIAVLSGISYGDFILYIGPATVVCIIINIVLMWLCYRNQLAGKNITSSKARFIRETEEEMLQRNMNNEDGLTHRDAQEIELVSLAKTKEMEPEQKEQSDADSRLSASSSLRRRVCAVTETPAAHVNIPIDEIKSQDDKDQQHEEEEQETKTETQHHDHSLQPPASESSDHDSHSKPDGTNRKLAIIPDINLSVSFTKEQTDTSDQQKQNSHDHHNRALDSQQQQTQQQQQQQQLSQPGPASPEPAPAIEEVESTSLRRPATASTPTEAQEATSTPPSHSRQINTYSKLDYREPSPFSTSDATNGLYTHVRSASPTGCDEAPRLARLNSDCAELMILRLQMEQAQSLQNRAGPSNGGAQFLRPGNDPSSVLSPPRTKTRVADWKHPRPTGRKLVQQPPQINQRRLEQLQRKAEQTSTAPSSRRCTCFLDLPRPSKLSLFILVLLGTVGAFAGGANLGWSAVGGAAAMMVIDWRDPDQTLSQVDWSLLVFFSSLFVVTQGFQETGLPSDVWNALENSIDVSQPFGVFLYSLIVLIGSNTVSNVPLVLLLGPSIPSLSQPFSCWLLLSYVSTVAGNLTLVGSVANLIVVARAKHSYTLTFYEYLRFGFPSTLLITFVGVLIVIGMINVA